MNDNPDRRPTPLRRDEGAPPERPRSHAHAADTLGDAPFLAYALAQSFKLFLALIGKRWPHLC